MFVFPHALNMHISVAGRGARAERDGMPHLEQIFTWSWFFARSCEDAAMNDKTLKCITIMSHEIKAIHRGALCEKYGNNIAPGKHNSPLHMKYVIRDLFSKGMKRQGDFLSFLPRFAVNTNGVGMSLGRNFHRINEKTKRTPLSRRRGMI